MKIYEIGTGYTPIPASMGAATEIVVEELTKAFQNQKLDVSIVDIKASDRLSNHLPIIEVPVPKKFTAVDVSLGIMHKIKRIVYSISLAAALYKLIGKSKEKIVLHFHNQYNMFFFVKILPKRIYNKCFIAYTNHSYIWHGDWTEIKQVVKKRYFQEIACMDKSDKVYVLNEKTAETLVNQLGIASEKILLIDNGVNTNIYSPLPEPQKNDFKREMGAENKQIFLQVGSVCERKNQLDAIKLLLPLLLENPRREYFYAGSIIDSGYQRLITDFVAKNGITSQVKYLGELKPGAELNKYYNLADVMVFPSKSEGFSLVIIEAMSAGVPVIINSKLQFKLAGSCLQYQEETDFEAVIRDNILNEGKQKKLAVEARNTVIKNYSWDKIAKDYYASWIF